MKKYIKPELIVIDIVTEQTILLVNSGEEPETSSVGFGYDDVNDSFK